MSLSFPLSVFLLPSTHPPTHPPTHLPLQVRGLNEAMDDAALASTLSTLRKENAARATKLETLRAAAAGGGRWVGG